MTTRPLLIYWISYTAAAVAIAIIMPLVSRSRRPHADAAVFDERGNAGGGTMRMPISALLIGAACFLFFWGMAILSIAHPDIDATGRHNQNPLIILALLGFSFIGVIPIL